MMRSRAGSSSRSAPASSTATPNLLTLHVEAVGEPALTELEQVVARHLDRFAFRDKSEVRWVRV